MRESLDEPVQIIWHKNQPLVMRWRGHEYRLGPVDFHHKTRIGNTLIHHFSMADNQKQVYVKLALNTDSLAWTIEECMYAGDMAVEYESAP